MSVESFFQAAKDQGLVSVDAKLQSSFQFGVAADELAELVLAGVKTATASAYDLYEVGEALPAKGAYDVVLNSHDEPVCLIQNDDVQIEQYLQVSAAHAFHEGEGDRSLSYWRQVHQDFFNKAYQDEGKVFREDNALIVLETFHLVYPR